MVTRFYKMRLLNPRANLLTFDKPVFYVRIGYFFSDIKEFIVFSALFFWI